MPDTRKIFVFKLSGEEYGIDVTDVKEVNKLEDRNITDIPDSSDFIEGITNVRGKVVPVIDLKSRFGLESGNQDFMMLVELEGSTAGILVDDVREVLDINVKRIKEAPDLLKSEIHDDYVEDVALLEDDRMITILNLRRGLSEEETTKVNQMAEEKDQEEEVEEVSEEEIEEKAREKVS